MDVGVAYNSLCEFCGRLVIYIHCFSHRLHLVVTAVMGGIDEIKEHFGWLSALYTFFKLAAVKEIYGGNSLKRLIDTRWSGHLQSAKVVRENYTEIISTLIASKKNKKLGPTERATTSGLLEAINTDEFIVLNHFLNTILKRLDIANKILQSSHESLTSALESIKSVREDIQVLRTDYDDVKIEQVIAEAKKVTIDEDARRKRATETSYQLKDFVITDRLPNRDDVDLRQIVIQSIDMIEGEFETRFPDSYIEIWSAMEALLPSSPNFS